MSDALKIESTVDAAAVSAGAVCGLLLSPVLASGRWR